MKKKEQLIQLITPFGDIQTLKITKNQFILFMTGKGLSKLDAHLGIMKAVLDIYGKNYPNLSVLNNEKDYYLLIQDNGKI